ncbi:uncharacterized protein LOC106669749 isoform X2 [Cimex lectularius]|nr:uncharacterized protein LOC106669749 isoform X2 [Cimex lectularius]
MKTGGGYFINCQGANRGCYNLSYDLMPQKTCSLLIFLYKGMAKISSMNETCNIKVIRSHCKNWICFSVIHKFKPLALEQVAEFLNHKIEFNLNEEKTVDDRAYIDQGKLYYCFNEKPETGIHKFEKVYPTSPGVVPEKYEDEDEDKYWFPESEMFATRIIPAPSPLHVHRVIEKMEPPNVTISFMTCEHARKPLLKKNNNLILTGDQLLYDKQTWDLDSGPLATKVKQFAIWISPSNMLSREFREEYIPLGISLKRMINVPLNLPNIDFSKLSLEYSLKDVIRQEVLVDNIDWEQGIIYFNYYKMHIFKNIPQINLIRALQFNKLKIKLLAPLKKSTARYTICPLTGNITDNQLFHLQMQDDRISKRSVFRPMNEPSPKNKKVVPSKVVIGCAYLDLSSILGCAFRMDCNVPITAWEETKILECEEIKNPFLFHDYDMSIPTIVETVNESKWISAGTMIKVSVRYAGPSLRDKLDILRQKNEHYKKIIIKFNTGRQFVANIIQRIISMNKCALPEASSFIPAVPHYGINLAEQDLTEEYPCLITGFLIDNFNSSLLVLEGVDKLTFNNSLLDVMVLPTSEGQVIYNSNLLFNQRSYKDFIKTGGIYIITLKRPFIELLHKKLLRKKGNCPVRALRAFYKIEELYACPSMEFAIRNKSFPSTQDLRSFEMEFGVPHYAKRRLPKIKPICS